MNKAVVGILILGLIVTSIGSSVGMGERGGETGFPPIFIKMEEAFMFVPDLMVIFISGVASLIISPQQGQNLKISEVKNV